MNNSNIIIKNYNNNNFSSFVKTEKEKPLKKLIHAGNTKLFFFDHLSETDNEEKNNNKSKNNSSNNNENNITNNKNDYQVKFIKNPKTVNLKILDFKIPAASEKHNFLKTNNISINTKSTLALKSVKFPNFHNTNNKFIHKNIQRNRSYDLRNNAKIILEEKNNYNNRNNKNNNNSDSLNYNNENEAENDHEFNSNINKLLNPNLLTRSDQINFGLDKLKQTIRYTKIIFPYLNIGSYRDSGAAGDISKTKSNLSGQKETLNNSNINNSNNNNDNNHYSIYNTNSNNKSNMIIASPAANLNNYKTYDFSNHYSNSLKIYNNNDLSNKQHLNNSHLEDKNRKIIKLNKNKNNFITASSPLTQNNQNNQAFTSTKKNTNPDFFISTYNKKTLHEKILNSKSSTLLMIPGDKQQEINARTGAKSPKNFEKQNQKNLNLNINNKNLNSNHKNEKPIKTRFCKNTKNEFTSTVQVSSEKENDRNKTNSCNLYTEAVYVTSNTNENEDLNKTQEKEDFSTQMNIMSNGNFVDRPRQKSNSIRVFNEKNIVFNINNNGKESETVRHEGKRISTAIKLPKINIFGSLRKNT